MSRTLLVVLLSIAATAQEPEPSKRPTNGKYYTSVVEEYVSKSDYVLNESPSCADRSDQDVFQAVSDALRRFDEGTAKSISEIRNYVASQNGAIAAILLPSDRRRANCVAVCAPLPRNAELQGHSIFAIETDTKIARDRRPPPVFAFNASMSAYDDPSTCTLRTGDEKSSSNACTIGWSAWIKGRIRTNSGGCVIFKNWSHNLNRKVRLELLYSLPEK